MELEEGSLTLTEIELSFKYKLKKEASTGSIIFLYISLSLILSSINSYPYYNMSQHSTLGQILRQQNEQIITIQTQIEMLVVEQGEEKMISLRPNTRFNTEVAKLPIFDGNTNKIVDFIIIYKLYKNKDEKDISR